MPVVRAVLHSVRMTRLVLSHKLLLLTFNVLLIFICTIFCDSNQKFYYSDEAPDEANVNYEAPTQVPIYNSQKPSSYRQPVLSYSAPEASQPSKYIHRAPYEDHEVDDHHVYNKMEHQPVILHATKSHSSKSFWPALILLSTVPSLIISLISIPILIILLVQILKQLMTIHNALSNQNLSSHTNTNSRETQLNEYSSTLDKAVEKFR